MFAHLISGSALYIKLSCRRIDHSEASPYPPLSSDSVLTVATLLDNGLHVKGRSAVTLVKYGRLHLRDDSARILKSRDLV